MIRPFITPVTPAGLPHWLPLQGATGAENLGPLPPAILTRLYWRLRSLRFEYAYILQNRLHQRDFTLTCATLPHERLVRPPVFALEATDPHGLTTHARLDFRSIRRTSPASAFPHNLALEFAFTEGDLYPWAVLTTHVPRPLRSIAALPVTFLPELPPIQLHLAVRSQKWKGAIRFCRITPSFFNCP